MNELKARLGLVERGLMNIWSCPDGLLFALNQRGENVFKMVEMGYLKAELDQNGEIVFNTVKPNQIPDEHFVDCVLISKWHKNS